MEEKEKPKDVGTTKQGRIGDSEVERNRLICVASDATWDHGVGSWPVLPQEAISGFMTLQQQAEVPGLGCYHLRDVQNWPHTSPGHCEKASPRNMRARELTRASQLQSVLRRAGPTHCGPCG